MKFCVITQVPKINGKEYDFDTKTGDGNLAGTGMLHLINGKLYFDVDLAEGMQESGKAKWVCFNAPHLENDKECIVIYDDRIEDGFGINYPVFCEGEILIIDDEFEREIGGFGRCPRKWWVEYELFENVEDAIKCSAKITGG